MFATASRTRHHLRFVAVLSSLAALSAVSSSSAEAQNTYYACYVPNSGTTYRIKTSNTKPKCEASHVEFSWKDVGPAGPQGIQGPKGDQGDPGPQGPAGASILSGVELHADATTLPADGRYFAQCPTGKSVVSFGHSVLSGQSPTTIFYSRPAINGPAITWGFQGVPGAQWQFYWVCADAGPAIIAP